jgi:peptidyl-prolyl cis-trans isomerase D
LDEVKSDIAAEIKKQKAAKKYAELADTFSNTVYEQSDSLKPVADKLNLKIETAANLTRQPNPSLAPGVAYNNAKFLNALFSDDAIKNKRNTDAIEVAPNTLIAGRIVDYKPATKRPFNEVEPIVREHVTQIEAAKLARKAGEEKLAALRAKDDTAGFTDSKVVSRAKEEGLNRAALASVMNADVSKLPAFVGVDLVGQGYGIYRIGKVTQPANVDKAKIASDQQQLETGLAQQEMVAYIDALKQREKVKILKPIATPTAPSDDK